MRKKNRLYYDDDLVSSPTQMKSPKKTPRGTPKKQPNPQPMPLAPVKLVSCVFHSIVLGQNKMTRNHLRGILDSEVILCEVIVYF